MTPTDEAIIDLCCKYFPVFWEENKKYRSVKWDEFLSELKSILKSEITDEDIEAWVRSVPRQYLSGVNAIGALSIGAKAILNNEIKHLGNTILKCSDNGDNTPRCTCKKSEFTRMVDDDFNPLCGKCGKPI